MRIKRNTITINANQAVAKIAYNTNEVCPIYPITPSSEMSELVEEWSAKEESNIFGEVPSVFEMQSEAGVAGTMHGALQTGTLSTTFTASQGLLLMQPNMFKIAGELTPNVIHVATRSIATHALSVFGDHSDIMAVRQTGYAFLGSSSVQEAQDFALISQAATLESRIPFVHFFDGFRTSHEINTIETISDETIKSIIDLDLIEKHRERALNPNNPVLRGTSQGADVFFQSREAINTIYNKCPNIVQEKMDEFFQLTGRAYKLFDYVGHQKAEHIIISMASSTETIEETINYLNSKDGKFGLIKVRLFRPFSQKHLLEALPKTVKSIAVLDRTKEPGCSGEPLYLDIMQSITDAYQTNKIESFPKIFGGRYGLSSKEFTPSMVTAIFNNLKKSEMKNNFTIGINDDVTGLSLNYSKDFQIDDNMFEVLFYQENKKNSNQLNDFTQLIGCQKNTYVQQYTECDYKKSNSRNISHIRISSERIKAPYLITNANLIVCEKADFIENDNVIESLKENGILLVSSELSPTEFWDSISNRKQQEISNKKISLFIVDAEKSKKIFKIRNYKISGLMASFLLLKNDLVHTYLFNDLNKYISEVKIDSQSFNGENSIRNKSSFSETFLGKLLANKGNEISVSELSVDGTFSTDTSKYNNPVTSEFLPEWDADLCTQCGACSLACPQSSLRIKAYDNEYLENAPQEFDYTKSLEADWNIDLLNYTIQINPDQCNGCNNCVDACSVKALNLVKSKKIYQKERENWNYFEQIPELNRSKIDTTKLSQQQLQEPLFKYSIGVEGCGEAPYLKLMSQLFGDRLIVANATGASSIFGGALPTTPWSKNKDGRGPAWSNSLFEDNAEFGLGYRLSLDQQEKSAKRLLVRLTPVLDESFVQEIFEAKQNTEIEIVDQRNRVEDLKNILINIDSKDAKNLLNIVDSLVKKSVWIAGGDGWAYDIGYGGIDHVIASGKNVNILVLDNEVYDNTGGQNSKATPYGSSAKLSFNYKQKQKKDLGLLAMTYDNVYVASVAIGANQEQTLKAFNEAESFDGPSIIIAYCHSDSHGIDMKKPSQYHRAAVDSGQWLLYRSDPRLSLKGENGLQLDSERPSIKIDEYLKLESRFSKLLEDQNSKEIIEIIQNKVDSKYNYYKFLSTLNTSYERNIY